MTFIITKKYYKNISNSLFDKIVTIKKPFFW